MEVTVLGPGCPKCRVVEKAVRQAVEEMGLDANVSKVEDIREMMKYRVALTPAVAIDGVVKIAGRIPTLEELKQLLSEIAG